MLLNVVIKIAKTSDKTLLLFVACIEKNVPRLVYTSTYNVVFGGQCIVNGDESLPYFPLDKVSYCIVQIIIYCFNFVVKIKINYKLLKKYYLCLLYLQVGLISINGN